MKAYFINLDRSPERCAFMMGQFSHARVDAERIRAVDGRTVDMSAYTHTTLRPPEIGCLLSHRDAWEKFLETNEAFAAIFEDDARLSSDIARFLHSDDWVPPKAEIVKLDTMLYETAVSRRAREAFGRTIHRLSGEHVGAAGYIVSRNGAKKLLEVSAAAIVPIDIYLFCGPQLLAGSIYQVAPALVLQRSFFESDGEHAFKSLLEHVELAVKPPPPKPRGMRKVWREVSRPFIRLSVGLKTKLFGPDRLVIQFR
ncbi:glycosyltransferase family 25 protein [Oryzicola mucosus]|uniref:Glycosyltransferase family 25 protein n=1 Tax=Oryzicola mucosus TaxID=2767425 RepID=A0A8J6U101_9HYPH|nr:glycosyltransferase family 25 protein [Oryzicola mucosus]